MRKEVTFRKTIKVLERKLECMMKQQMELKSEVDAIGCNLE